MDLETFVKNTCKRMYSIIYYYIDDKIGEQCPHGEKNNKTKEEIIKSEKQIAKPPMSIPSMSPSPYPRPFPP